MLYITMLLADPWLTLSKYQCVSFPSFPLSHFTRELKHPWHQELEYISLVGGGPFSSLGPTSVSVTTPTCHLSSCQQFVAGFSVLRFQCIASKENLLDESGRKKKKKASTSILSERERKLFISIFCQRADSAAHHLLRPDSTLFLYSRARSHYPQHILVSNFILPF